MKESGAADAVRLAAPSQQSPAEGVALPPHFYACSAVQVPCTHWHQAGGLHRLLCRQASFHTHVPEPHAQVLCDHRHHADGLEEQWFNEYCDMPRIPYHMYSLHGGAGALMSIGLMKRIKWEDFEACVLGLRSTGESLLPEACVLSLLPPQVGACCLRQA